MRRRGLVVNENAQARHRHRVGETEQRALPHLARDLQDSGITVCEVRIPLHIRALDAQMAENLIKAAWYENLDAPPDKFVLLIDLDGADLEASLEPIRTRLAGLKGGISAAVICAYAQEHLEGGTSPTLRSSGNARAGHWERSTHRDRMRSGIRSCISSNCSERLSTPPWCPKKPQRHWMQARSPAGALASRTLSTRSPTARCNSLVALCPHSARQGTGGVRAQCGQNRRAQRLLRPMRLYN